MKTVIVEETAKFVRDFKRLNPRERDEFGRVLKRWLVVVGAGQYLNGLRIRSVQNYPGRLELSWSGDGRLTFEYGASAGPNEIRLRLLRVGGHAILK